MNVFEPELYLVKEELCQLNQGLAVIEEVFFQLLRLHIATRTTVTAPQLGSHAEGKLKLLFFRVSLLGGSEKTEDSVGQLEYPGSHG
ncbi:MAG: hypothetical protein AAGJ79_06680 [Verrucomicrobiota bacterium]